MKKIPFVKIAKISLLSTLVVSAISWNKYPEIKKANDIPKITINGFTFSDLNQNGKLDKYEDTRLPMNDRIQDLISKMTDDEKQVCLSESECPDLILPHLNLQLKAFKVKYLGLQEELLKLNG